MQTNMIKNRLFSIVLSGFAVLTLAACGNGGVGARNPQVAATPDRVSLMLADAADRSSNALQTLAAIEQARTPNVSTAPITDAPPELQRAITLSWVGPVDPVVKLLADRAGYAFQTIGNPPPVPLVVSVDAENQPVVEILRSIGLQLGTKANVAVNGAARTVELSYVPYGGSAGEF